MVPTQWFGVTFTGAQRDRANEETVIAEIVRRSLLLQSQAASSQNRPLGRGTHVKGVCCKAEFQVFDTATGRDPVLAARLAKGLFARPGVYPAVVRFANSDPRSNSDFKPDVRSLSFSVDIDASGRQDFSLQNATTLPINDSAAFLATMKVLTAANPAGGLWALSFKDKLRVVRTLALAQVQSRQAIRPYQSLRYWSTVPFRHGPNDVAKFSATPSPANPSRPLQHANPNGLCDELIRHLDHDGLMSSFDFGVQFLDTERMTYWGKHRDVDFWIENASAEWHETEAPFQIVGRLTLLPRSVLSAKAAAEMYIDVTDNSMPDSTPVGSINRARCRAEVASRLARQGSQISSASSVVDNSHR
jgi:hypothetical protein